MLCQYLLYGSDSVIYIYIYIYISFFILFAIMVYSRRMDVVSHQGLYKEQSAESCGPSSTAVSGRHPHPPCVHINRVQCWAWPLRLHCMAIISTRHGHYVYTAWPLCLHCMAITSTLHGHYVYTAWPLRLHCMAITPTLHGHYVLTAWPFRPHRSPGLVELLL